MFVRYRYQFPIAIHFYKWGVNIWIQRPIVRKRSPVHLEHSGDGSISVWLIIPDD